MEVKKGISNFFNIFSFNSTCYFCLAKCNDVCCKSCERDFIKGVRRCPICAKHNNNAKTCGQCISSPPVFSSTTVLYNYEYPIKKLVLSFKFKKRAELSLFFADRFVQKISSKNKLPDILIPVPLHKKRQAQRGYNQSLELSKLLSKKLNVPFNSELCKRVVNTDPQSELPMKSRKKNVKNAFILNGENIPKHIAIIDDVITTGSTINEIARLFKKAGCEQIDIWAIART